MSKPRKFEAQVSFFFLLLKTVNVRFRSGILGEGRRRWDDSDEENGATGNNSRATFEAANSTETERWSEDDSRRLTRRIKQTG